MSDQEKLDNLLFDASEKGHTETIKGLLDAGADVHANSVLLLTAFKPDAPPWLPPGLVPQLQDLATGNGGREGAVDGLRGCF
jgi:hypothetical protein